MTYAYPLAWPPLRKLSLRKSSGVMWSHRGQKVIFTKKVIKSYRMRTIDAWLMHVHKFDPLYKTYHIKNHPGSFGVTEVMLQVVHVYNMTMKLIHVHQLETFYLCNGSSVNLGSFGVTLVKRSFTPKMHQVHENAFHRCVTYAYA